MEHLCRPAPARPPGPAGDGGSPGPIIPTMKLRFTKMQGAGNDFIVLDATREPVALDATLARRLADRHFGVGADQILLIGRIAIFEVRAGGGGNPLAANEVPVGGGHTCKCSRPTGLERGATPPRWEQSGRGR